MKNQKKTTAYAREIESPEGFVYEIEGQLLTWEELERYGARYNVVIDVLNIDRTVDRLIP